MMFDVGSHLLHAAQIDNIAPKDIRSSQTEIGVKIMIIDCHAHVMPKSWFHPDSPKSIFDLDGLFRQQDEAGVDITVFGNNWIRSPQGVDALTVVKEFNEHAAELTTKHAKRLLGLACSVPFDNDQILKETERAITEYQLKGIMINSSVNGEYLDSPRAIPFFELVTKLNVPLFVHPPKFTIGNEKMEIFRLPEMLGRPFDTTLSLTRFIFCGGFERFPDLKIVCAHVGGALPMLPGRYGFGYELRKDMSFGPWEPDVMTRPPATYIRQLYVDTVCYHPPAVQCAIATVGVEHVVFGSDSPPVPLPLKKAVDTVQRLTLSKEDKQKVLGDNAAKLLGLTTS
jgi:predicted TIM-barrel fold metal-dependent hydrolase